MSNEQSLEMEYRYTQSANKTPPVNFGDLLWCDKQPEPSAKKPYIYRKQRVKGDVMWSVPAGLVTYFGFK